MGLFTNSTKITEASLSEVVVNAIQESIQKCETNASQSQTINVTNGGFSLFGKSEQIQDLTVNITCVQESLQKGDISNSIVDKIVQDIKAKNNGSLAILDKGSDVVATAWITNIVRSNITVNSSSIMNNVISQTQTQNIINEKGAIMIAFKAKQSQAARLVAKQMASTQQISKIITDIVTEVDQKAKNENTGVIPSILKGIGDIIGSAAMAIPALIGSIILLLIVLIGGPVFLLNRRSKKGGEESATQSSFDIAMLVDGLE